MKQYLLSIYQPDGDPPPSVDLEQIMRNVTALDQEMKAALRVLGILRRVAPTGHGHCGAATGRRNAHDRRPLRRGQGTPGRVLHRQGARPRRRARVGAQDRPGDHAPDRGPAVPGRRRALDAHATTACGALALLADQDRYRWTAASSQQARHSCGAACAATSPAHTRCRRPSTPCTATHLPRPPPTGRRSWRCTTSSCRSIRAPSSPCTAPSPWPRSTATDAALTLVDDLDLDRYYLFHAIRADLLRRRGRGPRPSWRTRRRSPAPTTPPSAISCAAAVRRSLEYDGASPPAVASDRCLAPLPSGGGIGHQVMAGWRAVVSCRGCGRRRRGCAGR